MSDTNKYIEEDGVAYLVEGLKKYADNKLGGISITDILNCPRVIFNYSQCRYTSSSMPDNVEFSETLYISNSNIDSVVSNNYDQITDGNIIFSGEYLALMNFNMVIKPEKVTNSTNDEVETGDVNGQLVLSTILDILEEFNTQLSNMTISKDIYSSLNINSIAHIYISPDISRVMTHLYTLTFIMDSNVEKGMWGKDWSLTLIKLG